MARTNSRVPMLSAMLDFVLLWLSQTDAFRLRDIFENVLILAGIGAGKSSAIGKAIRHALLKAGFAGIVLIAKPDEVETWLADARACGRERSIIIFDETQGFNFIAHELARQGADGINAVVEYLMRVLEMVRIAMPGGGRPGDAFWESSARQLFRMILPVLYSAFGTVRLDEIIRFLVTAPTSVAQLRDEAWQEASFMWRSMFLARTAPKVPLSVEAFARIASYWKDEFAQQDVKLRTSVTATVSTSLDRFMHGRLNRAFCQETTIVPELIFEGAIILCNMPTLVWNEDGVIAQQLFKYAVQRTILSRNGLAPEHRERPVFIYADEAQSFINSYDPEFMAMSRSSRCASICLTQSIPAISAKIGGDQPKIATDAFLSQFGTKIFGNNSCPETNRFAAETIGRSIQRRANFSQSESSGWSAGVNMGEGSNFGTNSSITISPDGKGGLSHSVTSGSSSGHNENTGRNRGFNSGESTTGGFSEAMDYEIEPAEFSRSLKAGGPANGGIVTAIWFQAGRRFEATGRNYLLASFRQ